MIGIGTGVRIGIAAYLINTAFNIMSEISSFESMAKKRDRSSSVIYI